jgi:hypothetical protein
MRVTLDLQGSQSISLSHQGVIYEVRVTAEDRSATQIFSLEGSLDVLRDFFDAGRALVEEAMEQGGATESLEVVMIGPPPAR